METNSGEKKILIDNGTLKNLNSIRKWTTFLSIMGFIFLGLIIVAGMATGLFLTTFKTREATMGIPESLVISLLLIAGTIYFFPVFFLFRFSRSIRDAIQNTDQQKFEKGLRNLRLFFTYLGIILILVLSIYVMALIFAGSTLSFLQGG
jgi:heme/copper-type cytochrome/quinol oxidase subunit 2